MKFSKRSFAIAPLLFTALLLSSVDTLNARDAGLESFAAGPTAKQKCLNTCRARYHDCRNLKQLPKAECRGIYQDCTQYTCTGKGPC